MVSTRASRKLPIGADLLPDGGVNFRVWAPGCRHLAVVLEREPAPCPDATPVGIALAPDDISGYFSGAIPIAGAGTLYRYRLDDSPDLLSDPASRFQPYGPHGPSQIIDPAQFPWTDQAWPGVCLVGQVIYEMHLGTFTPEGTWEAASRELPELADAGITLIEVMPIADFPGRFGWGKDGVNKFAPTPLNGTPEDCRRFVDRAQAVGLGVERVRRVPAQGGGGRAGRIAR